MRANIVMANIIVLFGNANTDIVKIILLDMSANMGKAIDHFNYTLILLLLSLSFSM